MYLSDTTGQFISFGPLIKIADGTVINDTPANINLAGIRRIDGAAEEAVTGTFGQGTSSAATYQLALSQADTNGSNITYTFTATGAYPIIMTVAFWDATALAAVADAVLKRDTATVQGTMPKHCLGVLIHGLTKWTIQSSNLVILNTVTGAALYTIPLNVGSSSLGVITGVDSST